MKDISHLFTGISKNVYDYVNTISEIKSKKIIDIPAGDGRLSAVCKELGASVDSYDIQTGDNKYINQEIKFCDMNNILPIKDNYADIIICQEGIEHLPNQYFIFR